MPSRPSAGVPTGIGAIIMAWGIFGAAALQRIPQGAALTRPLAMLLALGWLAIAAAIARGAVRRGIAAHTGPLIGSFAIGTWIAASIVVGRMAMLGAPDARWLAEAMFVAAVALWLWFVPRALRNLARIARLPASETQPSGVILLTTVATQAVALAAFRLSPAAAVRGAATALMAFGLACYGVGAVLIARRYLADPRWRLATDWDNTNCILHGALSITGLTAVISGLFGLAVLAPFWAATLAVFVIVEAIELARLGVRVGTLGWREAVLAYDVSQWARNFTFGMFYAFTAALAGRFPLAADCPALAAPTEAIIAFGQYVVLLLLVGELALMARGFAATKIKTAASFHRAN